MLMLVLVHAALRIQLLLLLLLLFNDDVGNDPALENFVEWCDQSYFHVFESTKNMCIDLRNDCPSQTDTVIHTNKVQK